MRWLALALVTGCSFSPAGMGTGGDVTPVDAPPRDTIELDAPDAPPGMIDTDHDGTQDLDDNCPAIANADQHDEDGDGRGDVCDLCPQLAAADTDTDGDGVGNACDPHPAVPGDTLLRFETFAGTTLPAGWTSVSGNAADWKVMSDALSITSAAAANGRFLLFDTAALHHTIDIGFTVDAAGTPAPAVTELVDVDAGVHNAIACTARIAGGEGAGFYSENYSNDQFTTVEKINPAPAVGGTYRLFTTVDVGFHCDFVTGTGSHPLNATITSATTRTRVALRVRDMSVRIPWIAVYTSP